MKRELAEKIVKESADTPTIISAEGEITYVSPSVKRMLGYDPEELTGEIGFEYQHPDDRERVTKAIEALQENPDQTEIIETRFRRADGSWCWVESTLQNRLDDPVVDGILVYSRDISDRKQREQQFRTLAKEYRTLLETVNDGIFFLSVESAGSGWKFYFERVNHAYEEATGIGTAEVRGQTPTDVFGDELGARLEANYHRCVRSRESIRYEEELPVETGARCWETTLTPVFSGGEPTRIIGLTRDTTDRVKRERQLRSKKEQLDEFASVISHDIRNPLDVAQGRTELLKEECESDHIAPVERSLNRIEELVSDTLTLARQGQIVSETEPIEVVNLVGACWRSISTAEATIEIEDEITLIGDQSRLQHVFENIFRNAVEHGGSDVTVRVGQIDHNGIYVENTGPPIPEDNREDVFQPGHTSAQGGTGFGLTIVKRIVEAHGWAVSITEGSDGGARFEFTGVEIIP
jgi:PAS domain S-box-containing protein